MAAAKTWSISADWIVPGTGRAIRNGVMRGSGATIDAVGSLRKVAPTPNHRDLGEVAVLPGLINAHTHLELTHLKGELKLEQKLRTIELKAETEMAEARLEGLLAAEEIDLGAVRKSVSEIAEGRGELEFAKIEGVVKAKRLLTDEQRKKLKQLLAKGMMPRMGSGTKGGQMMQGMGSGTKGGQMMQGEGSGMKQGGMMKPAEEGSGTK